MGEYKVIYEIVANTMKQLQAIADGHMLDKSEQIEFFRDMKDSIDDDIDAKIIKLETMPNAKSKIQILEDELKKFDYTYEHSDDHRCWRQGCKESERIQKYINELHPSLMGEAQEIVDIYSQVYGHMFTVPTPEEVIE